MNAEMKLCVGGPNPTGLMLLGEEGLGTVGGACKHTGKAAQHTEQLATCESRVEASPQASLHLVPG